MLFSEVNWCIKDFLFNKGNNMPLERHTFPKDIEILGKYAVDYSDKGFLFLNWKKSSTMHKCGFM